MGTVVYVPFLASVAVAVLSRLARGRLWPRAVAWATVGAASVVTISAVGALVLLACPLPARLPMIATLGRWQPRAIASDSPTPLSISIVSLAALAVITVRAATRLWTLVADVRAAATVARSLGAHGDGAIVVVDDQVPAAHSLGGAIVVTSSMVGLLDGDERAAVIAHERAHARHRHTVFLAVMELAAALNPILTGAATDTRFTLERWADEDAAAEAGRPTLASALAKAALGVLGATRTDHPAPRLAFDRHGVNERVAALLAEPDRRSRPTWVFVALSLVAAVALAWATHNTERFFEAARLWPRHYHARAGGH